MRAPWQSLHAKFAKSIETMATQTKFNALRQDWPELRCFPDHYALLDRLHDVSTGPEAKDVLLAALVTASQGTGRGRDLAVTLMWLALWPGLDAMYRRLWRYFSSVPDDLVSEISERFTTALHRLDLNRVNRIAATLLRNIEREIRTGLRARWAETARRSDMPDEEHVFSDGEPASLFGLPTSSDTDTVVSMIAGLLTRLVGEDAGLVLAVVVLGDGQREIAGRLGLSHDAVRKRFQRAIHRLRKSFGIF